MRALYAERLAVLLESSRSGLQACWKFQVSKRLADGGLAGAGIGASRAAEEAKKHEVEVVPLSRYSSRRSGRQGLVLGFAAVDSRELRRGVEQLARALEQFGTFADEDRNLLFQRVRIVGPDFLPTTRPGH